MLEEGEVEIRKRHLDSSAKRSKKRKTGNLESKIMENIDEPRPMVEIHCHPKHLVETRRKTSVDPSIPSEETGGASLYLRGQISLNPVILSQIFRHLAPADLKSAALVCRTWRRLVERPAYWGWAETRLTRADFTKKFRSPRLRNIGAVRTDLSEAQMRKLLGSLPHWRLRRLALSYINLSSVSPDLLCSAIGKLDKLELCLSRLTGDQVRAVFTTVAECEDLSLRSLSINFNDLTSVPGPVLSRAIVRLKSVNLWLCRLTTEQVTSVFTTILKTPDLRLETLTLNPSVISSVPAGLISAAVVRLEEVNFSYTDLSSLHLGQICQEILAAKHLRLRSLQLNSTNLSSLEPSLLARALVRLEKLDLYNSCLTEQQLEAVLEAVVLARPNSLSLTTINIGGNELSSVQAELLAAASLRLAEIRLADTQLTAGQVTEVFRAFLHSQTGPGEREEREEDTRHHRCLHVGEKEVAVVCPEVLAQAEEKLQHCHLTNSWCLNG